MTTKSPIEKAVIEVAGGCNYACKMCPHHDGREKAFIKAMSFDMFTSIIDQLPQSCSTVFLEGSGEPTLNKQLVEMVRYVTNSGRKAGFVTNGSLLNSEKINQLEQAGVDYIRLSIVGYDQLSYISMMGQDNFDHAVDILRLLGQSSIRRVGWSGLIINPNTVDLERRKYIANIQDRVDSRVEGELWRQHNWAGSLDDVTWREGKERRSCGRPDAPDLIVRAGGNDGHTGGVVPCCHVLGQDSKAIMGHLDDQTIDQVWTGERYEALREAHHNHDFDSIDFCKNCDMLYEAPDSLVWSNYGKDYNTLTGDQFDMEQYRQ